MPHLSDILNRAAHEAIEIALETVWPTRCAVCDQPSENVVCDICASKLRFIDTCLACPNCGAPYGLVQCTDCNDVMLAALDITELPVCHMASAVQLDEAARRIVALYKDADERRLCPFIAATIARYISPDRIREGCVISYIPDTKAALRRRGFDHAREIAEEVAALCGVECTCLFKRPKSADQRHLNRRQRIENMAQRLQLKEDVELPAQVMLIDDVCTTGATIFGAAQTLRAAGVQAVYATTFGRVLA